MYCDSSVWVADKVLFQHQKYGLVFLSQLEHDIFVGQPGEGS